MILAEQLEAAERVADGAPLGRSGGDDPPPGIVRFLSPKELLASVPQEPPWRWHGYLTFGAVTVLGGKPKAGKSTLAFAIAQAVSSRASRFLGHAVDGGPVVYVSEEGASTLVHKVDGDNIRIATRDTAWPRPEWPALIHTAEAEAKRVGAVLVVLDTFAFWAGLGPESEKDAGAVQAAMEPLVGLARSGLAVLLIVHQRKGGGEDGEGLRGSSALAGAADIIIELERVGDDSPRQRKLLALSRYPQTPGVLVVDHDRATGGWMVLGEGTDRGDARDIASRSVLLEALEGGEALSRTELERATGKPEREWHDTVKRLIDAGVVEKIGAGVKGDPYRYRILRNHAAQNPRRNAAAPGYFAAAPPLGGQQDNHGAAPMLVSATCAGSNGNGTRTELSVADLSDEEVLAVFPGATIEDDR